MKKKKINAVKTVRLIRDKLYEKTKNMSPKELIKFYRRKAAAVQATLQGQRKAAYVKAMKKKPRLKHCVFTRWSVSRP